MNSSSVNGKISAALPRDGYDIPVYGIADGSFLYIHIPAIACLIASIICAILAMVFSSIRYNLRTFYSKWSKPARLVVYLSFADGMFALFHLIDHLQMVVTRDHVRPRELCTFFSMMLLLFVLAQTLTTNFVAWTTFLAMYFDRKVSLY